MITEKRMKTSNVFKKRMKWHGELLPGMPNDITLKHICTKLSWRDVHVLSSVNPGWQQALRSGEIYESRVDSCSRDTLAVNVHIRLLRGRMPLHVRFRLYSFRENYSCDLPEFPFAEGWHDFFPKLVSLDRNIYVLGQNPLYWDHTRIEPAKVFKLDVAERQWKQCASMRERKLLAAAALNGKIYACTGERDSSGVVCEVYDPKIDAWSTRQISFKLAARALVKPVPRRRISYKLVAIGEELCLYGRTHYNKHTEPSWKADTVSCLNVYHPIKDEWRQIVPSQGSQWITAFPAGGKFYRIMRRGIEVYDIEEDSWSLRHTFHELLSVSRNVKAFAFGDELLIASSRDLFQSEGFGRENTEITLKKLDLGRAEGRPTSSLKRWTSIQL